jgi:acyl-CoA carboxylase subunit beta
MARDQKVRAIDLHDLGIVDRVVAEKPDAAEEPEAFCQRVGAVLEYELSALLAAGPGSPAERTRRYV